MGQIILKRNKINTQLNNIFDYPLTVVIAAMGYGKTTSVREFLNETKANYFWLSVENDETSAQYIWNTLTRQLAKIEPVLGNKLNSLGFPIDAPQRNRLFDIIAEYTYAIKTVLVIDDYHFAHSPELDGLLEKMIRTQISGLHIVVLSRTEPEINIEELQLKGYCHILKNDLFELSEKEIKEYFKLFGQDISNDTSAEVYDISEGWITAVYLIIQRYREIGKLEPGSNINDLIETAIMSRYTPEEVRLLLSLCIFDSFTPQQAVFLTGDKMAAKTIQRLSYGNSLIRRDEQTETYRMHNIFSDYLRKILEERFGDSEIKKLYRRFGEWYIANDDVLSGMKAFLKAEEYDLILVECEKPEFAKLEDRYPQSVVELFEQIPEEVKYKHPIGYLAYADFYLSAVDLEGGMELMSQIEQYYKGAPDIPLELKKRIFGEIELSKSFVFFNDLEKMHKCHLKAYQLLNGSSVIANKEMTFTFGSPHTLYLYHREKGKLRWIIVMLQICYFLAQGKMKQIS
jgi:LuxR family maltose regulon positive regulatory protein